MDQSKRIPIEHFTDFPTASVGVNRSLRYDAAMEAFNDTLVANQVKNKSNPPVRHVWQDVYVVREGLITDYQNWLDMMEWHSMFNGQPA